MKFPAQGLVGPREETVLVKARVRVQVGYERVAVAAVMLDKGFELNRVGLEPFYVFFGLRPAIRTDPLQIAVVRRKQNPRLAEAFADHPGRIGRVFDLHLPQIWKIEAQP